MSRIDFSNSTALCSERLLAMIRRGTHGWAIGHVVVRVRYSRGADFSGACHYRTQRIFVNIGRHVNYPYALKTHVARARTLGRRWYRPLYVLELISAYELAAFIFMHELYHLLVKRAGRNVRQKEGRCDRFAARFVVDTYGSRMLSDEGRPLSRGAWDVQDVESFVAAARDGRIRRDPRRFDPVEIASKAIADSAPAAARQMLLFAV